MATAYTAGIVRNHPFVDGNKRTGFVVGILFLELSARRGSFSRWRPGHLMKRATPLFCARTAKDYERSMDIDHPPLKTAYCAAYLPAVLCPP